MDHTALTFAPPHFPKAMDLDVEGREQLVIGCDGTRESGNQVGRHSGSWRLL